MKINIHNCEKIISDIDMKKNFKNFRSCEATDDRVESTLKISIAHIMWEFVIEKLSHKTGMWRNNIRQDREFYQKPGWGVTWSPSPFYHQASSAKTITMKVL